jgi:membrane-associated phospholipid phosphatase
LERPVIRFRRSEWIALVWFAGAAVVGGRPRFWLCLVTVLALFAVAAWRRWEKVRDWLPYPLILLAYRSVGWMATPHESRSFEEAMVVWDRKLLEDWLLRAAIEGTGSFLPNVLEFAYLLVYGMPAYMVALFWLERRRDRMDLAWVVVLLATLGAYAMYPFVPSDPPRAVFPNDDLPVMSLLRRLNLAIVGNYGIHTSVFPSGHAAAAFGSAFALLLLLPERPWPGRLMLLLAVLIAVATVYGRYHYAVDTLAGFVLAVLAVAVGWWTKEMEAPGRDDG